MAEPLALDSPLWSDLEAAFPPDPAYRDVVAGTTLIVGTDTGATVLDLGAR